MIYLIYKKSDIVENVPTYNKLETNLLASTLVFNNLSNRSHTVFKYMKSYNEALRCFEHYTCEIDGFVKSEINNETVYKPVASKTMKNSENKPMDIDNVWDGAKINIGFQCKLSDVNNVIFGFRYNSKMKLQHYDIPKIINGVEYRINKAFKRMEHTTTKIVRHYKRSQFLSLHNQHQL
uniref:Uncharacterized protein n=1 Tax=Panagrolaimus sp. PS1159 TaxID=55785 RepID=A0AC35F357_9BILA